MKIPGTEEHEKSTWMLGNNVIDKEQACVYKFIDEILCF